MLDIKFIRQNPEALKEAARKKHVDFDVEHLLAVDSRRRELLESSESLKAEQNKRSKGPQSPKDLEELKGIKEKIKILERQCSKYAHDALCKKNQYYPGFFTVWARHE